MPSLCPSQLHAVALLLDAAGVCEVGASADDLGCQLARHEAASRAVLLKVGLQHPSQSASAVYVWRSAQQVAGLQAAMIYSNWCLNPVSLGSAVMCPT